VLTFVTKGEGYRGRLEKITHSETLKFVLYTESIQVYSENPEANESFGRMRMGA
jgi:hypothetical protein